MKESIWQEVSHWIKKKVQETGLGECDVTIVKTEPMVDILKGARFDQGSMKAFIKKCKKQSNKSGSQGEDWECHLEAKPTNPPPSVQDRTGNHSQSGASAVEAAESLSSHVTPAIPWNASYEILPRREGHQHRELYQEGQPYEKNTFLDDWDPDRQKTRAALEKQHYTDPVPKSTRNEDTQED